MRKNLLLLLMALRVASAAYAAEADSTLYSFTWSCGEQTRTVAVPIDDALLAYYRIDRDHLAYRYSSFNANDSNAPANYFSFVYSTPGQATIRELAMQLVSDTMTMEEQIRSALTFVQFLPYTKDSESKGYEEYVRFPLETVADGTGDCEDKAVLLAALLGALDMDYVLFLLPDHAALGVHCDGIEADRCFVIGDKKYYYLETTNPNWEIGQIPKEHGRSKFEYYPPTTTPTLIVKGVWFESAPALPMQQADCSLKLELYNAGPDHVDGLQLEVLMVKLGSGREEGVAELSFPLEALSEGVDRTYRLNFRSPVPKNAVIRMRLSGEDVDPQLLELKMTRRTR